MAKAKVVIWILPKPLWTLASDLESVWKGTGSMMIIHPQKLLSAMIGIALSFSLFILRVQSNSAQQAHQGRLKGKVIAPPDIGVAGVPLTIQGENVQYVVRSDGSGFYQIELPEGIYQITTSLPDFFPFRRSSFRIRQGEDLFINVHLIPDPNLGDGEPIRIRYDEIKLPHPSLEVGDLLVAYVKRAEETVSTRYEVAILTYNSLTIMADSITLDRPSFRFFATGNVVIDDGKGQTRVRRAEVFFTPQGASLETTKGVIYSINGKGSLDDSTTFDFSANRKLMGYLSYEDKKQSIRFVSTEITAFDVMDEDTNKIRVLGGGIINNILSVNFTMIVQKGLRGDKDTLSINFHINNLSRIGNLVSGNIEIHREN